jgi:hypothetical protein
MVAGCQACLLLLVNLWTPVLHNTSFKVLVNGRERLVALFLSIFEKHLLRLKFKIMFATQNKINALTGPCLGMVYFWTVFLIYSFLITTFQQKQCKDLLPEDRG